jgi:hypothetical protein
MGELAPYLIPALVVLALVAATCWIAYVNLSKSQMRRAAVRVGYLAFAGWLVWASWHYGQYGWHYAQREGWIVQRKTVPVDFYGDWMVGEYRDCASDGDGGFLNCPIPGQDEYDPSKTTLSEHTFSVAFWGDIGRDVTQTSRWQCKRESDSISCHAH